MISWNGRIKPSLLITVFLTRLPVPLCLHARAPPCGAIQEGTLFGIGALFVGGTYVPLGALEVGGTYGPLWNLGGGGTP